jgi:hypothetical protein
VAVCALGISAWCLSQCVWSDKQATVVVLAAMGAKATVLHTAQAQLRAALGLPEILYPVPSPPSTASAAPPSGDSSGGGGGIPGAVVGGIVAGVVVAVGLFAALLGECFCSKWCAQGCSANHHTICCAFCLCWKCVTLAISVFVGPASCCPHADWLSHPLRSVLCVAGSEAEAGSGGRGDPAGALLQRHQHGQQELPAAA